MSDFMPVAIDLSKLSNDQLLELKTQVLMEVKRRGIDPATRVVPIYVNGNGPYWRREWWVDGKRKTQYIGKKRNGS